MCTQSFIVNLPTATFNEGEEAGSLRSPVKGCSARFINSLHHKEHLQTRQTPSGPPSLTDALVYCGTIWLTKLINLKNSKIGFKCKSAYRRFGERRKHPRVNISIIKGHETPRGLNFSNSDMSKCIFFFCVLISCIYWHPGNLFQLHSSISL